jgi:UDP-N-acetylmuramoyl-L-alanyl-D-glutamate--2,6-diaminopimelate ligase
VSPTRVLRPEKVQPRPLAELLPEHGKLVPAKLGSTAPADVTVTGVTHDSRAVQPGDLYAALPGSRAHGADFAAQAALAGAVAVLTDPAGAEAASKAGLPALVVADPRNALGGVAARVYGDPSAELTVVGITGTNGKTTTAYLIEAGLRAAGHITGLLGTVETRLADEVLPSVRTTPEAPELQALLAVARERGVTAVVMEVSSHALALGRVEGIRFAAGVFTNLGEDHLDFHADLDEYFAAKAKLFDGRSERAVINVDDPAGRRLAGIDTITVSPSGAPDADWRVADREPGRQRQTFRLYGPDGLELAAGVGMPGRYNVDNAALAVAALAAVGVEPAVAAEAVACSATVPGRMEQVRFEPGPGALAEGDPAGADGVLAVVDYAHDPLSVAAALAALRPITQGRLICVLGCGGDRDTGKRPLMGAAAARGSDVFIVTDDNPRSEDPWAIRAAMLAGVTAVPPGERGEVVEVADRRGAINEAVRRSEPGDTIAVLGKGHEQGQEVGDVVHPFNDREVLAAALREVYG